MEDFLSFYSNIENPTLGMVGFTILVSFLLSTLIGFTYEKTSVGAKQNPNFIQALILSSIVAATVMQAIGDSVATGLGILGALAIIRFRTTFRDPRDIIFIFATLGAGIACGVYGFTIAVGGTIGFCIIAFILRFTPLHQGYQLRWELRIRTFDDEPIQKLENDILKSFCRYYNVKSAKYSTNALQQEIREYEYILVLKNENDREKFLQAINDLTNLNYVRMERRSGWNTT